MKSLFEATSTNSISQLVGVIEQSGMDQLILDHFHPTTDDNELNKLISQFQASFYDVIRRLELQGHITIHGTKIRRNLNK